MKRTDFMKKCEYCAKEISYFDQFCSEDCQECSNRYYETLDKFGKLFSVVNVICVFGIPIGIFLFSFSKTVGAAIASVCCMVLGILLIFLPFPTDSMIRKFKLKKARNVTRIVGLAVILLGFAIMGFLIFFNA